MLTKEEIKTIINNPASSPLDQIKVIVNYINDLKKVELDINKINPPRNGADLMLLTHMYLTASIYYRNE